jgi:hypothetical protein
MENEDQRKKWREQKQAYRKSRREYILICSNDEAQILEKYANEKQMSVTEFIKSYLKKYKTDNEYVLPNDDVLKNLIIEIRRIGNNLNQVARYVNANKTISENDFQIIENRLSELEKIIVNALTNPSECDHQINSD